MKGIDSNNDTINIAKKVKINKFNNNDVYNRLYAKRDIKKDINRKKIKPKLLFDFPPKKNIINIKNNNIYKQNNLITNKLNSKNLLDQSKKEIEEIKNIGGKIKFDISD